MRSLILMAPQPELMGGNGISDCDVFIVPAIGIPATLCCRVRAEGEMGTSPRASGPEPGIGIGIDITGGRDTAEAGMGAACAFSLS